MIELNNNLQHFANVYLFGEVAKRVSSFRKLHPEVEIIRMDVGDVSRPLCPAVMDKLREAVDNLSHASTFKGYGPEYGYGWLRERIAEADYRSIGIEMESDEVFINDGCATDIGGLGDLFSSDCSVALQNPTYPAYADSSLIDGRAGFPRACGYSKIEYLPCTAENGFAPALPSRVADLIYLCSPNNPTGSALCRSELQKWVDYARSNGSIIILDAAYASFIRFADIPHSIYELPGAREVAIELKSFSKRAGFTGLRCGYTIVPKELKRTFADGSIASLNDLWRRRVCTKSNGPSYPAQMAAMGVLSSEGLKQTTADIDYYLSNARMLRDTLSRFGLNVAGGENSPYVWAHVPDISSWDFFDHLLAEAHVSCTPGAGFGSCGEGYVRFTGFNTRELTIEAAERIQQFLKNL